MKDSIMYKAETERKMKIANIENKDTRCIDFLNQLLVAEFTLFTKNLNYHWNVTGPRFYSLHNFLEEHYKTLLNTMDDVAERIKILGATPISTVEGINKENRRDEINGEKLFSNQMIQDLLDSNNEIIQSIKSACSSDFFNEDPGTEDFVVGILKYHEETSWMLKSHIV